MQDHKNKIPFYSPFVEYVLIIKGCANQCIEINEAGSGGMVDGWMDSGWETNLH